MSAPVARCGRFGQWPALLAACLAVVAAGIVLLGGREIGAGVVSPPPTACTALGGQGTCTLTFTSSGTWVVPAGVTSATATVDAGAGGAGWGSTSGGGAGSSVTASFGSMPSGTQLTAVVGRAGANATGAGAGGGGGEASKIADAGTVLVVAGGGGGGGAGDGIDNSGGAGGAGGAASGSPSTAIGGRSGQGGAGGSSGGVGGSGDPQCTSADGQPGQADGTGGAGGHRVHCALSRAAPMAGGAGGAGVVGGGGGGGGTTAGGGGGGGSDAVDSAPVGGITVSELDSGAHPGTGSVTITYAVRAPTFTTADGAAFPVGQASSFVVEASGVPAPTISEAGTLPAGVTFTASSAGTAVLSGTPAAASTGTYPLVLTASNGIYPQATQAFTVTVRQPAGTAGVTTGGVGGGGPIVLGTSPAPTGPGGAASASSTAFPPASPRPAGPPSSVGHPSGSTPAGTLPGDQAPAALAVTGIDLGLLGEVSAALVGVGGVLWVITSRRRDAGRSGGGECGSPAGRDVTDASGNARRDPDDLAELAGVAHECADVRCGGHRRRAGGAEQQCHLPDEGTWAEVRKLHPLISHGPGDLGSAVGEDDELVCCTALHHQPRSGGNVDHGDQRLDPGELLR